MKLEAPDGELDIQDLQCRPSQLSPRLPALQLQRHPPALRWLPQRQRRRQVAALLLGASQGSVGVLCTAY